MGGPGRGVVVSLSGSIMPDAMEEIAARHGRRIFMSTAVALYNEQYPQRALGLFDSCAAAQARGNELYIQITCQPLSFDFTLANAYPFYSHPAFDPIKAYDRAAQGGVPGWELPRALSRRSAQSEAGHGIPGKLAARHYCRAGETPECRSGRPYDRRHCA
jgi:hypothetical protein